jgi:hypothetical protein
LANSILTAAESKYQIPTVKPLIPERIKEVRKKIIQQQVDGGNHASEQQRIEWNADMQDMFLVTQLYSYPGDYLQENPSWERQAETLDKLQEDVLGASYPSSHGRKTVSIRFGEPIAMPIGKEKKANSEGITTELQQRIQSMLDAMNLNHSTNLQS